MTDIINFNQNKKNKLQDVSLTIEERLAILSADVRKKAYAPYSNFKVGASILSDVGIHIGANVENASYGCGVCAEASAISAMIAEGGKKIKLICVSGESDNPVPACGNCRQKIREFAEPDTQILIVNEKAELQIDMPFEKLLPMSFGPDFIK